MDLVERKRLITRAIAGMWIGLVTSAVGVRAQAPVDKNWSDRTAPVTSLTVMIDSGPRATCMGAGIVVGVRQTKTFVMTADHVLRDAAALGPLTQLGARFRFIRAFDQGFPYERRAAAKVLHRDAAADLAALEIDDAEVAQNARMRLDLKLAGDSQQLTYEDRLYVVGCGDGFGWDVPTELAGLVPDKGPPEAPLSFSRNYARKGFSGGPLVHVFNSVGTIVGMTLRHVDIGRAATVDQVLRRARAWGVPVDLTAPGTGSDCTYIVSAVKVALTGDRREVPVQVETGPTCEWSITSQSDSMAVERQGYWLEVSGPDGAGEGPRRYVGPGRVLVSAGPASPCDGVRQQAVARVAGQMIQIGHDGRCTSPSPPSRVSRNPSFVKPMPPGWAKTVVLPPSPTDAASAAAAREAIAAMDSTSKNTPSSWGCNLFGCHFYEGTKAAFCHPAVTRVELGDRPDRFTFQLERAMCANWGNQRDICYESPHMPLPVSAGKTIYARVHFGDGTTMVKPFPIDDSALQLGVPAEFRDFTDIRHWTVLEPIPGTHKEAAPFAALAYAVLPSGNRYALFVGMRGCVAQGSYVKDSNWFVNIDGTEARLTTNGLRNVTFAWPGDTRPTRVEVERMPAKTVQITLSASTVAHGKVGPYAYRVDLRAPVLQALNRPEPAKVICRYSTGAAPELLCQPNETSVWSTVIGIRFGPAQSTWREELSFRDGELPQSVSSLRQSPRSFTFAVPKQWRAVHYQLIYADGRRSPSMPAVDQ